MFTDWVCNQSNGIDSLMTRAKELRFVRLLLLDVRLTSLQVPARVLPPPFLQYGQGKVLEVGGGGAWNPPRGTLYYKPAERADSCVLLSLYDRAKEPGE